MKNKYSEVHRINFFWLVLVGLTLFTTFIAESATPTNFTIVVVCFTIAIKGRFVIDEFMGLREAVPLIRYTIHSYFILLPVFIALTIIFPEVLAGLTSIS
ncbi:MAG: cytochrome C oxidase subunit IV family protein [gamma proteobacterium symbiont of Taylorina sp.]|nr:cytochrome C oxidase subunit IV family protein [gamma proteobacterium symbiont of Taylorina sp.]